jgi:hypothetical protein
MRFTNPDVALAILEQRSITSLPRTPVRGNCSTAT